jgi:hypothetical protein
MFEQRVGWFCEDSAYVFLPGSAFKIVSYSYT